MKINFRPETSLGPMCWDDGRDEICPYLWLGWFLVTWERDDFWRTLEISLLPD